MIRRKIKTLPEFNTTALPDIIFMLLFFFMVATVLKQVDNDINLSLPKTNYGEEVNNEMKYIEIKIHSDQSEFRYTLNNRSFKNLDALEIALIHFLSHKESTISHEVKLLIDSHTNMKEVNALKNVATDAKLIFSEICSS